MVGRKPASTAIREWWSAHGTVTVRDAALGLPALAGTCEKCRYSIPDHSVTTIAVLKPTPGQHTLLKLSLLRFSCRMVAPTRRRLVPMRDGAARPHANAVRLRVEQQLESGFGMEGACRIPQDDRQPNPYPGVEACRERFIDLAMLAPRRQQRAAVRLLRWTDKIITATIENRMNTTVYP